MPIDAYIKFGKGRDPEVPERPFVEGDSTDVWHFYWCELRDCNLDLKVSEAKSDVETDPNTAAAADEEEPKGVLEHVTIKKRVDWASTTLFKKCCETPKAQRKKAGGTEEYRGKGWIDEVTVEICRQSGAMVKKTGETLAPGGELVVEKFPFIKVVYKGVQVIDYGIDMRGPEPEETIKFKALSFDLVYEQTDPKTGKKTGKRKQAIGMKSFEDAKQSQDQSNPAADGNTAGGGGDSAVASAVAASVVASSGASGSNAMPGGAASTTDAAVTANYPGLWTGTGFGVLPD